MEQQPAVTIRQLVDETMQDCIRRADPNLKKWGYALFKKHVTEYWIGIAKEADAKKKEQVEMQKLYPKMREEKVAQAKVEEKRRAARIMKIDGDEMLQSLSEEGLLKKRPLYISTPRNIETKRKEVKNATTSRNNS